MNNAYDEIPKYLKQKESNVSKAHKKSKHKHQYAECLIRYKCKWHEKEGKLYRGGCDQRAISGTWLYESTARDGVEGYVSGR